MSVAHESLDDFLDEGMDRFLKYRWEFLRRNDEYQQDYQEIERVFRENDCSLDHYSIAPISVPTNICSKWDVNHPVDPSVSYDEYYFEALKNEAIDFLHWRLAPFSDDRVRELGSKDFARYKDLDPDEISEKLLQKFLEDKKQIIEINLRYSKAKLLEAIKQEIDTLQTLLEYEGALKKEDRYGSKLHYDNFDYYLAVYDLKEAGRSWTQVREALRVNGIKAAEIHTARDYYKAAKGLVEEGLSI